MAAKIESIDIAGLMAESGVGFGTSGARGLVSAMTDRVCYLYTVAFLQYLERQDQVRPGDSVAIAGDYRASTGEIMAACAKAVADLGYTPINCGRIPTPAVSCFAIQRGIPSLMVTGSHIPDDRNGIKFNQPGGEILKSDEQGIREQVCQVPADLFDEDGRFREPAELPAEDNTAFRHYVARYLDFLPSGCLAGSRVLIYEHSSVSAAALWEILTGLGADVVRRGFSEAFLPVDTEAVRAEDIDLGREWAAGEDFDMLVSADGDGDRPLVSDEHGEWLRGDVAGVLTACFLEADTVVTPVSSNTVVEKSGWFNHVTRTRIGSPYVIEGMQAAVAGGAERVVGYEANGGFLTMSDITQEGRTLAALPTRDAVIVPLALLLIAKRQGKLVSELAESLPKRYTASDRLQAFPSDVSRQRIRDLVEGGEGGIMAFLPGLGGVADIDQTDGLRITFAGDEVVHLRPSGNAPELRCYTESGSADEARALNRDCIARLEAWRESF